ncbi:hypothetical protein H4217_009007, partial [Coemansia sp. RSA 1939]
PGGCLGAESGAVGGSGRGCCHVRGGPGGGDCWRRGADYGAGVWRRVWRRDQRPLRGGRWRSRRRKRSRWRGRCRLARSRGYRPLWNAVV